MVCIRYSPPNKAMTKVVIAINGAECERKQGNDEGSSLQLEMQSCQNDVRAMTPCFYLSNERASLGLSRPICTKSVASVILEIGRAKERHQQWPWWDGSDYAYEVWKKLGYGKGRRKGSQALRAKTKGIWCMCVIAMKIVLGVKSVNSICLHRQCV